MDRKEWEKTFIKNTLSILNNEGDCLNKYNVSLLLNCCLWLLIVPSEKKHALDETIDTSCFLFEDEYIKIDSHGHELKTIVSTIEKIKFNSEIKKIKNLVKFIRNGLAHFKIEIQEISDTKEITSIKIKWSLFCIQRPLIVKVEELKKFIIKINK